MIGGIPGLRAGTPFPVTIRVYGPMGDLLCEHKSWTWGQVPNYPPVLRLLAARIEMEDGLGRIFARVERPVFVTEGQSEAGMI
jgi:hypothetical protein